MINVLQKPLLIITLMLMFNIINDSRLLFPELCQNIFLRLNTIDLFCCDSVCQKWRDFIDQNILTPKQIEAKKEQQRIICSKRIISGQYCHSHKYSFISKQDLCVRGFYAPNGIDKTLDGVLAEHWPRYTNDSITNRIIRTRDIIKYMSLDSLLEYLSKLAIEEYDNVKWLILIYRPLEDLLKVKEHIFKDLFNDLFGDDEDHHDIIMNKDFKNIVAFLIKEGSNTNKDCPGDINYSGDLKEWIIEGIEMGNIHLKYCDLFDLGLISEDSFIKVLQGYDKVYWKPAEAYFKPDKVLNLDGIILQTYCGIWLIKRGYEFTIKDILTFSKKNYQIKYFYSLCRAKGYFDNPIAPK